MAVWIRSSDAHHHAKTGNSPDFVNIRVINIVFDKSGRLNLARFLKAEAAVVEDAVVSIIMGIAKILPGATPKPSTLCNAHPRQLSGTLPIAWARIIETTAAVVKDVVVSIVMDIAALSVIMPGRVIHVIVDAASDREIIVCIVMGRVQRAVVAGFIANGELVTDFVYVEVINGHRDRPFV